MADAQKTSRSRSRSRSPHRYRSASPPRRRRSTSRDRAFEDRRPKQRRPDAGFRWKDRRPNNRDQDRDNDDRRDGRLDRGYRRRSRSPRRDRGRDTDGGRNSYRPRDRDRERDRERDNDVADKFGLKKDSEGRKGSDKKSSNAKPASKVVSMQQPMIIVHVNDRLGTKTAIPCLPSDTVGDFRKLVAAQIGRQPHEILLKRQGERPFKDILTLEDYGVSSGVQLDLEVDTGE